MGSKSVSKSTALATHALSNQHKDVLLLEKARITTNNGNNHIINIMKMIYWMAKENIPISKLPSLIHILKLIEIVHSIPFSSVDCEKSFSKQNIIKCNVMKNDTLHILMMVGLEGTDLFGYDLVTLLVNFFKVKTEE